MPNNITNGSVRLPGDLNDTARGSSITKLRANTLGVVAKGRVEQGNRDGRLGKPEHQSIKLVEPLQYGSNELYIAQTTDIGEIVIERDLIEGIANEPVGQLTSK